MLRSGPDLHLASELIQYLKAQRVVSFANILQKALNVEAGRSSSLPHLFTVSVSTLAGISHFFSFEETHCIHSYFMFLYVKTKKIHNAYDTNA